ncbi:S-adenosyl-L-methionine-dependent methyltransferase [Hypoxylon trugodes]|uniref:S-adenosyl-L-methionine-dependent methyltransferase n=1 Tax=Hypoxylon trugodes TaxID=326681 RepID=UPI0021A031FA|nr:S-adenosyl-L-methionine-dependent methyltransferase [Hypoxylon trugodes]KAI1385819.1 S-adenosyl-L-methionine-dependent methyltransferase [Hypoxylon trugodes]
MDMDDGNFFTWQRLPGSDHVSTEAPLTPDSSHDQSLFGSPSSHLYEDVIQSIEEDAEERNTHNHGNDLCIGESENIPIDPVRVYTQSGTYLEEPEANPYADQDVAPDIPATDAPKERPIIVEIPKSTLIHPRSHFQGFVPPVTEVTESEAIVSLLEAAKAQGSAQEGFIEFDLHDFSVYFYSEIHRYELKSLHQLAVRQYTDQFYFDGVLSCGEIRFYLRKVPFRHLPVGNYGSEEHTVGDQIWIRSALNEKRDKEIYYKLGNRSTEYERFYEPFLWIANLTKHVLDYCEHLKEIGRRAVLDDFKSQFSIWLVQKHSESTAFQQWHSANRGTNFRGAIIANIEFIWKEAYGLDPKIATWHELWDEVKDRKRYKPNLALNQLPLSKGNGPAAYNPLQRQATVRVSPTPVTPFVYDLFSYMVFGNVLKRETLSGNIEKKQKAFVQSSRLAEHKSQLTIKRDETDREMFISSIAVGDVISTKPDDEGTDTQWKQTKSKHHEGEHLWFGLIWKIHESVKGKRSFDVIWLYQSIDTPCGVMKYPWNNKLFLSNNCTCHHNTAKIQADEILSTHSVEWFGGPSTSAEFFVRQTYLSDDCRWTTLKEEHLTCEEDGFDKKQLYKTGDAVLVETDPKILQLETFIVEAFFNEGNTRCVKLRKLLRRQAVDKDAPNAPLNELVYTDQFFEISTRKIFRHCLVRSFQPGERIPTPYDCGGTGDLFFITHQEIKNREGQLAYVPFDMNLAQQFRQGFDPTQIQLPEKLQGLDLFCGGGNFGRGLEEGGAVTMRWANDVWSEAIHTYMANSEPGVCTPFLGSVDDLLLRALKGNGSKVPQPGDVHFISAGSPCPGFSLLTNNKTTDTQRKNQSLVASFASFVDLYRPYYGILENVPTMVNSKRFRDACVFSQLVCALVGLGYQTQAMFLDAWSFGAPQARTRIFLCFTAPGFRMPKVPAPSHSHPPGTRLSTLGEISCGRPFDSRKLVSTPFKFVSIGDAIADLPNIQDAKPDYCVGYPDHRLSIGYTTPLRKQLFAIPTQPRGMNFSKAWFGRPGMPSVMSASDREVFPGPPSQRIMLPSKGWGRVDYSGLFQTIATQCTPTDARIGYTNHPTQLRSLTVMEIRRAQGFRDHEVLVAPSNYQWRIIGNSVARQVSLALGLKVREAWFGTLFDEGCLPQVGVASTAAETEKDEELGLEVRMGDEAEVPTEARVDIDLEAEMQAQRSSRRSETVFTETSEERVEIDAILGIETSTEEEQGEGGYSGFSASSVSTLEENTFLVPTPPPPNQTPESESATPATSEEGIENGRKRPASLFVGIWAKRQRANEDDGNGRDHPGLGAYS